MINHLYTQSCLLLVSLFLLSSCQKENLTYKQEDMEEIQPGTDPVVPGQDQFIVSYALGEGESSRAAETGKRPIRSLHYYVYDANTNRLYKKRQIRGIDENTIWPISDRSKMSWELRQDLQDTLSDHSKYRILFIANADPKLFKKVSGEGGEVNQQLIINDEDYTTAQLVLPQEAFTDNNMYFMWEGEIDRTGTAPMASVVKRSDIVLRRVVTRMDFHRKIALNIADKESEDDILYHAVEAGLYLEKINDNKNSLHIDEDAVNRQMQAFEQRLEDKVIGSNWWVDYYPYSGPKGAGQKLKIFLDNHRNLITPVVKDLLIKEYIPLIKKNNKWIHSVWKGRTCVKVNFVAGSQVSHLNFNRKTSCVSTFGNTRIFPVDANGNFSIIGFGLTNQNHIESLQFYDDLAGAEISSVANVKFDNTLAQKMNCRYDVYCNPAGTKISFTGDKKNYELHINLDEIFKNNSETASEWTDFCNLTQNQSYVNDKYKEDFMEYIRKYAFLEDGNTSKNQGFGTDFTDFIIPFGSSDAYNDKYDHTIPDLTSPDAPIVLYPSWMVQE